MDETFPVKKGDVIKGSIAVKKSSTNPRDLDIKLSYHIDSG
jgi:hypothetical protein